ncbi:hypothetical protein QTP88_023628 [Uroleucon formosanum]
MEHIWEEEVIPQDWNSALICPIYKKGDPLNCNNYRGIALLNVSYKILAYCILDRIKPRTEELLGDYQCGFRQNRSTTDQIFNLRQIFQKAWEYDKNLCVLFVDFKKAYDSIHRPSLINIMKKFSFPKKLVNLVEATLKYTEIKVKAANRASEPVRVTTGLRQGDALLPVLFNLVLEKVIREANITGGNSVEKVKSSCRKLMKTAGKVGLQINDEKTEYILVNRREVNYRQGEIMEVDNHSFKRVSHFNYLGSILTNDNNIKVEIDTRLKKGNNCYYGLGKVLSAKAVSKNLKVQIYTTLIRPVVLYGSETWPLRKAEQMRLEVFERKILRRIFGPCKDDQTGEWRKRHNQELQNLFQRPDITKEISVRRLRWAGHAWRKQGSIIRIVIENNPAGKRPLGRPRLRWEDCVIKDVGRIGANLQWREEAEDRNRWRSIYLEGWS